MDKVELIETTNLHYTKVRLNNGKETSVSIRLLAPLPEKSTLFDIDDNREDNDSINDENKESEMPQNSTETINRTRRITTLNAGRKSKSFSTDQKWKQSKLSE